jgi:hypothetical protein
MRWMRVLVAPTSRSAAPRSLRPAIELDGQLTRVLVEQTTADYHTSIDYLR